MIQNLEDPTRKVLIVDDQPQWPELLAELFSKAGVETVVTDTVEAAQSALTRGDITEVITDTLKGRWTEIVGIAGELPVNLLADDKNLEGLAGDGARVGFFPKADPNSAEALVSGEIPPKNN